MAEIEKIEIGMIVGPTASGKTAVSIALARRLNAEIISADSIQIYKGLDIGSAKPTVEEQAGIPHHLLDTIEIDAPKFSVAEYQKMAGECIADVHGRGKFPLVVGGTGLYVNALTYPLAFTAVASDPLLRQELTGLETASPGKLYEMLRALDPNSADRLHPNDIKRIIRALEVVKTTGNTIGEHGGDFSNEAKAEIPYNPQIAGLAMPREMLYARIEERVDAMMRLGLREEAEGIFKSGYSLDLPALQGLGYKQLFQYFRGECTIAQAVEAIKRETRRFAKRQITWFKRDPRIQWFDVTQYEGSEQLAENISIAWGKGSPVK